jgi:FKBP-type peptidyl-prolyl cis-trans isomerase
MSVGHVALLTIALSISLQAEKDAPKGPQLKAPETPKEKASYGIGVSIGKSLKKDGAEVDLEQLFKGLQDALLGRKQALEDSEIREALAAFQKETQAKMLDRAKTQGEKNKKEGAAFLDEHKKKEGVKTTPSGLQYKIIKAGTGKKPKATDTVTTHYRGTLIDGTEFDSSYARSEPTSFRVNQVIKGWTEALQMMPAGSKWQIVIPSELAYGEQGAGPDIGPHSVLIFDIELISIQ